MNKAAVWLLGAVLSAPVSVLAKDTANYQRCLDKAVSTVEIRDCTAAEIAVHDQRLNSAYRALRARLSKQDAQSLRQAQRRWIRQRDHQVRATAAQAGGGGTAGLLEADSVYLRLTQQRADELEARLKRQ